MFAPPPAIEAEVFTRLPESLRKTGHHSEWREGQPGTQPEHSLLEGPSFDLHGNLYCVDVAFGRVFRVSPEGEWTVITEYDGWPNGLKIHKDGRIEETVSGIKGSDCTKITGELNEKLGEVIKTEATEEMFEQKVEVEETNTATVYDQKFSEW